MVNKTTRNYHILSILIYKGTVIFSQQSESHLSVSHKVKHILTNQSVSPGFTQEKNNSHIHLHVNIYVFIYICPKLEKKLFFDWLVLKQSVVYSNAGILHIKKANDIIDNMMNLNCITVSGRKQM